MTNFYLLCKWKTWKSGTVSNTWSPYCRIHCGKQKRLDFCSFVNWFVDCFCLFIVIQYYNYNIFTKKGGKMDGDWVTWHGWVLIWLKKWKYVWLVVSNVHLNWFENFKLIKTWKRSSTKKVIHNDLDHANTGSEQLLNGFVLVMSWVHSRMKNPGYSGLKLWRVWAA